jgi:hypothetical protein
MNQPIQILLRLLLIAALLMVVLFCAFGFLASFELAAPLARLPWQMLYGGGGVVASFSILRLVRSMLDPV